MLKKNLDINGITGWTIEVLEFDSRRGLGIFLFTTVSKTALDPTQPPIQSILGAVSLEVKWIGRAEVENAWSYTSTPPIRLNSVVLSLKRSTGTLPYLTCFVYI